MARIVYDQYAPMGASHFFVGMGAGIAILSVPVLTFAPGLDLPHRLSAWIDAPAPRIFPTSADNAAAGRPERGYRPGDPMPTPGSAAPPTVAPVGLKPSPTPAPGLQPASIGQPAAGVALRTGVIRGNGTPVYVRRAAAVQSADDPILADGSPVLVSAGGGLQIGAEAWRAVRGLNGIVGWVLSSQVAVDGEAPITLAAATVAPSPTPQSTARIAQTGGIGVVLRNSPRDADRSRTGLMDGTAVRVIERSGADWVHVRADDGHEGWVPAQYVAP